MTLRLRDQYLDHQISNHKATTFQSRHLRTLSPNQLSSQRVRESMSADFLVAGQIFVALHCIESYCFLEGKEVGVRATLGLF